MVREPKAIKRARTEDEKVDQEMRLSRTTERKKRENVSRQPTQLPYL